MTKVSVIVPVYNSALFLRECIESILSQSIDNFEVLLIDDGSTDKSREIVDEYARAFPNVRVFHTENRGYASACNLGLSEAKSEYVSIIDSDDIVDTYMIENLYNRAIETNADVAKSRYSEFWNLPHFKRERECGAVIETRNTFTLLEHPELLRFHPSIWTCLYRNSFLRENNISFVSNPFRCWEDNLFQIQTLYLAKRIVFLNKSYYHWRNTTVLHYDKIKDARIPFEIIKQTHDWLDSIGCTNNDIYENLFYREAVYLKSALAVSRASEVGALLDKADAYFEGLSKLDIPPQLYAAKWKRIGLYRCAPYLFYVLEKIRQKIGKTSKILRYYKR